MYFCCVCVNLIECIFFLSNVYMLELISQLVQMIFKYIIIVELLHAHVRMLRPLPTRLLPFLGIYLVMF